MRYTNRQVLTYLLTYLLTSWSTSCCNCLSVRCRRANNETGPCLPETWQRFADVRRRVCASGGSWHADSASPRVATSHSLIDFISTFVSTARLLQGETKTWDNCFDCSHQFTCYLLAYLLAYLFIYFIIYIFTSVYSRSRLSKMWVIKQSSPTFWASV